jgi:transposase
MLNMTQINHIRDWYRDGMSIRSIAQKMSMDRKTVRKYINMSSFSPEQPTIRPHESKLDPFKEFIETALENDRSVWEKQRHTATRLHNRLKKEFGDEYTCSYPLVQRYVKEYRKKLGVGAESFNELEWQPGEAQVDFFDVDIDARDGRLRKYMLALSFPYSNAAYHQLFSGVTAECVTQGLKDIFTHIGGVPSRLVFDNATGVGKQVKNEIHLAELFSRFRAHYGFDVSFCNPDSGHD